MSAHLTVMLRYGHISDIISLIIEKYGPLVFALSSITIIYHFEYDIARLVQTKRLNITNLYGAVLSWASIQVGFAFAVYGFVIGKTQGFVEAIRKTDTMYRFLIYVKRANLGGFLLTFVSLPLAVLGPSPSNPNSTTFMIITAWFSLFVWTFFAFLRIAFNFGHLSAVRDRAPFIGA